MFKFRVARITDPEFENRWAYLINDSDECKRFLKNKYDFDVKEIHYGQWFMCTDDAQWTCQPDKFAIYYRIIDVAKEEHGATNFNGLDPTCAGMHTGECKCSITEKPIEIKDQNFPVTISVSCSKENGFFMSVDFATEKE